VLAAAVADRLRASADASDDGSGEAAEEEPGAGDDAALENADEPMPAGEGGGVLETR
jgi:hypothetical protein